MPARSISCRSRPRSRPRRCSTSPTSCVAKVMAAAERARSARLRQTGDRRSALPARRRSTNRYDVVVIGVSTGGPQGLKSVDPAAARRFSRAGRDRPAHADRVYRGLRQAPRRGVRVDRASKRATARVLRPGLCSGRPRRSSSHASPRRVMGSRARPVSTSARSTRRTGRRSTCCFSRRPRCTAIACSAS